MLLNAEVYHSHSHKTCGYIAGCSEKCGVNRSVKYQPYRHKMNFRKNDLTPDQARQDDEPDLGQNPEESCKLPTHVNLTLLFHGLYIWIMHVLISAARKHKQTWAWIGRFYYYALRVLERTCTLSAKAKIMCLTSVYHSMKSGSKHVLSYQQRVTVT